ncbi:MAG: FG-GAP repeat protein [Phycisphaerales bacterium]
MVANRRRGGLALAIAAGAMSTALADDAVVLFDPNPNPNGAIGTAVALTPTRVIVGAAPKRSPNAQGAATSFGMLLNWSRAANGVPVGLPQSIAPGAGKRAERFGESIAVVGSIAIVGSPGWDPGSTVPLIGRVRAVSLETGAVLFAFGNNNATARAQLGAAVAFDGSTAVVGSPGSPVPGNSVPVGVAYVYAVGAQSALVTRTLQLPVADTYSQFGRAVAMNATHLVVGAPGGAAVPPVAAGRALIFDRNNASTPPATLSAPKPETGDRFGQSLAMNGDVLVIGSPGTDCGPAAVYVYRRTTRGYVHEATLAAPGDSGWIGFGNSVAIDRERVAVGTGGVDSETSFGSHAAVFRRAGRTWIVEAIVSGANPFDEPSCGAVALDPEGIVVSDPLDGGGAVRYVALPRSADLDFDGIVGASDLGVFLGLWGTSALEADFDGDGVVGSADLGVLLGEWS